MVRIIPGKARHDIFFPGPSCLEKMMGITVTEYYCEAEIL